LPDCQAQWDFIRRGKLWRVVKAGERPRVALSAKKIGQSADQSE